MIALDSSAIMAIVLAEPEGLKFSQAIESDGDGRLSAANFLEIANVMEGRYGASGQVLLDGYMVRLKFAGVSVVAFDEIQAEFAREGFRRFGKGRHPAKLNFGDCFAYALAKALDAPLLYKGDDFDKTDIKRA